MNESPATPNLAPIALFAFNRPEHTRFTLEALQKNALAKESELHVFCDGPRKEETPEGLKRIQELRGYLKKALHENSGFKRVTFWEQDANLGLAKSIIQGVSRVLEKSKTIIVLEDDIVTTRGFLSFVNQALNHYQNEASIFSITGYQYPVQLEQPPPYDAWMFPRASSWGWATWKDRWQQAKWDMPYAKEFLTDKTKQKKLDLGGEDLSLMLKDQIQGKINSWAIRWCYTLSDKNGLCVYPTQSLVQNIGHDGSGVHCEPSAKFETQLNNSSEVINWNFPPVDYKETKIQKEVLSFFKIGIRAKLSRFFKR